MMGSLQAGPAQPGPVDTDMRALILLSLLLGGISGPGAFAQAGAGTEGRPGEDLGGVQSTNIQVLVLPALPFSPQTASDTDATRLAESIAPLLAASLDSPAAPISLTTLDAPAWEDIVGTGQDQGVFSGETAGLDAAALDVSRELGGDVLLLSFYEPQSIRMLVLVLAYDAWRGRIIAARIERPRAGIRFTTELDDLAIALNQAIAESADTLVAGRDGVTGEPVFVALELWADLDGMSVSAPGRGKLGTISNGTLSLPRQPFVAGQEVIFELSHPDHYTQTASVRINAEDSTVVLPVPPRRTRAVAEIRYDTTMPLGGQLGFLWHLVPDRTVIGARIGLGFQAPSIDDLDLGVPELETAIRAGVYPLPNRTAPLRLRLESGVAVRTLFTEAGLLLDPRLVIVDATVQRFGQRLILGLSSALSVRIPLGNARAAGSGLYSSGLGLQVSMELGYRW